MSTGVALHRAMAETNGIILWRDGDGNWVSLQANNVVYQAGSTEAVSLDRQMARVFAQPGEKARFPGPDDGDNLG